MFSQSHKVIFQPVYVITNTNKNLQWVMRLMSDC